MPIRSEGEQIPLEGPISAVADVYDALSSKRAYRFDPPVVGAFLEIADEIREIQAGWAD